MYEFSPIENVYKNIKNKEKFLFTNESMNENKLNEYFSSGLIFVTKKFSNTNFCSH